MSFWDLLSSVLTGGATGLLGVITTKVTDYFAKKQAHQQRMEVLEYELKVMEMEAEKRASELAVQKAMNEDDNDALVQKASYEAANRRWSTGDHPWLVYLDLFRGITRPGLTWLLVCLTALIYFTSDNAEQQQKIIATVLYLTTAAATWWFGVRGARKPQ